MTSTSTIYRAPPNSGSLALGQTLPDLLDQACDRHPNEQAFNQWHKRRWQAISNTDFRQSASEAALGLLALELHRGDRVAFVMHGDIHFCIADMGCLLAGLVNVPIDLTQTIENILFILHHTAARSLVISNLDLLYQVMPYLDAATRLESVIIAEVPEDWEQVREDAIQKKQGQREVAECTLEECLQVPHLLGEGHPDHSHEIAPLPRSLRLFSLDEVRQQGRDQWSVERLQALRHAIAPSDLATILYIASETKRPKGVMLTHENIAADILAAFSSYPNLGTGAQEVALIFLPLTHIFARAFLYGHMAYGHSIYFSDPNHVVKHLKLVNPTILITVPRLLEKVYERFLEQGQRLTKFDRTAYDWAVKLAHRYQIGKPLSQLFKLQLRLADRLVFAKWRSVFGTRMKALICGGAALRPEIANVFSAAGIPVLQGYGLTETSAVLCYNRGNYNRAGTVGLPIPGVEIAIAADSEILVKSPFVMQGYYRDPEATQQVLNADGWLHTGDVGEITADGFLKITGVKKSLFKLSTGKYVSPLPLEQELIQSPLVTHAIAVGANHKFCGMLIVPDLELLQQEALHLGIDLSLAEWLQHPCIQARYHHLIEQANCHLPYWSTVRKFRLIAADFTIANGLLHPDGSVNRGQVLETFAAEIAALYEHDSESQVGETDSVAATVIACPVVSVSSCPIYAKSLTHY